MWALDPHGPRFLILSFAQGELQGQGELCRFSETLFLDMNTRRYPHPSLRLLVGVVG